MNYNERNNIPSCSALGRIKECGGSWSLSQGVPDTTSVHADKGTDIHVLLREIIEGRLKNPASDAEMLAWTLFSHMQKQVFNLFGQEEVRWTAEKRIWMGNDNLEPILSGQYDALVEPVDPLDNRKLVFDAKTGWLAGDVPPASRNAQMQGLAAIIYNNSDDYIEVYGSIVREWAADEPELIEAVNWVAPMAGAIARGEYDVWHKAGLQTGDHCQFCPAKGNCPAYRESLSMVVAAGSIDMQLETMAPDNLVRILKASPMAEKVIEAAKKEAHRRRLAGEELPGIIWAKGNQKRSIKDEEKILMRLKALGIEVPTKLDVKLSDVEKAYGKKNDLKGKPLKDKFNQEFSEFLEISENAPSIEFEA